MWNPETDNKAFKELLERYQCNPTQTPNADDITLVKKLFESYIDSGITRDPNPINTIEGVLYKKICELQNIFLEEHCKRHPEILKSYEQLEASRTSNPMVGDFPLLKTIKKISHELLKRTSKSQQVAFSSFNKPIISTGLSDEESQLFNSESTFNFPYAHPTPDPKDPTTLSYDERVNQIYTRIETRQNTVLKLESERDSAIRENFRYCRARSLKTLTDMYLSLNIIDLENNPYIFHNIERYVYRMRSDFNISQLPHPTIFSKLLKLHFQHPAPFNPRPHLVLLLAHAIISENPKFHGYKLLPKIIGKDMGFILVAPGGTRHFAKYTGNTIPEYFCSKALSYLGIKMPESSLLTDEYGNQFYVTRDVSRIYTKETGTTSYQKHKNFKTIEQIFGRRSSLDNLSKEELEKLLKTFLEQCNNPKTRVSYAKILLATIAFGLSDVFVHGGNIGIIDVHKGPKHYKKFGIVDFQFEPKDITQDSLLFSDPMTFLKNKFFTFFALHIPPHPVYVELFKQLRPKDILQAAQELAEPKVRGSFEGLLLQKEQPRESSDRIMQNSYDEIVSEFKALEDSIPASAKSELSKIFTTKDIIARNLVTLTTQFKKLLTPIVNATEAEVLKNTHASAVTISYGSTSSSSSTKPVATNAFIAYRSVESGYLIEMLPENSVLVKARLEQVGIHGKWTTSASYGGANHSVIITQEDLNIIKKSLPDVQGALDRIRFTEKVSSVERREGPVP